MNIKSSNNQPYSLFQWVVRRVPTCVLFIAVCLVPNASSADFSEHLVGRWRFDDGAGTTAVNSVLGGYDGSLINMSASNWVSGKIGGALRFNGNGYVRIPQATAMVTGQQFTVTAWVQMDSTQSAHYPTIIADMTTCGVDQYSGFWLGWDSHNAGLEGLIGTCTGSYIYPLHHASLTGKWSHVAMTYDGAAAKIYLNGGLVATESGPFAPGLNDHLYIGWADDSSYNYFWQGDIDDVQLYNTDLSSNEVKLLYHMLPDADNHLIGWWQFDDGVGTSTVNSISGGYDGSLVNMSTSSWVSGVMGGALQFDGSGYVRIPQATAMITGQQFTVTAWVELDSSSQAQYPTIVADLAVCGVDQFAGFWMGWDAHNAGLEGLVGACTGSYIFPLHQGALTGQWRHVALSYDGVAARLFLNGELVAVEEDSFSPGNNDNFYIGWADDPSFNYYWKGVIDDVKLYDIPLGEETLSAHYLHVINGPTNVFLDLYQEYSSSNPTSIVFNTLLDVEMPYSEDVKAFVFYRIGSDWQEIALTNIYIWHEDGWVSYSAAIAPYIDGECDQALEYFGIISDSYGYYYKHGSANEPHTQTILKQLSSPAGFLVSSNQHLGRTNQLVRSVGYVMYDTTKAVRHKILPEEDFGDWYYNTGSFDYYFLEVPNEVGNYTIITETLSAYNCTTIYTNEMGIIAEGLAFIPATNFGDRLRADLIPLIPTNPSSSDVQIFSSYSSSGTVVWSGNWTTNFDFTGVAWDRPQSGTLISSQHMMCVAHYRRHINDAVVFHDRNGDPHYRTIIDEVTHGFTSTSLVSDCIIYLLDEPLPETIKTYKFLPATYRYITSMTNSLLIYTDAERKALLCRSDSGSSGIGYRPDTTVPGIFWENLISGDSGNQVFAYIDGELVLISLHTGGGTNNGSGTFYANPTQHSGLVHLLEPISNGSSISIIDMTGWGTYE